MKALKFIAEAVLICCFVWFMIRNIEQMNDTPAYETGAEYGEIVAV